MWPPPIRLKMLVAIAILPMLLLFINTKQTWANDEVKYGLGGYKIDVTQQMVVPDDAKLLNTTKEVLDYKTNGHADTQFKPCSVKLNNGKDKTFELFYDKDAEKDGCTVDVVYEKKLNVIVTRIKVMDKDMTCLEHCGDEDIEKAASSKNIVPFTYSLSNDDIKKLHNGPPYNEDQKSCKSECTDKGGKCMGSATSLQLAWVKCKKVKARAWIQLVGEPVSKWSTEIEDKTNPNVDDLPLFLTNVINQKFPKGPKVPGFKTNKYSFLSTKKDNEYIYPACFLDYKLPMIPEAKSWQISSGNTQLNGKHLLVFHLLPQTATRIYNAGGILENQKQPAPGLPKCVGKLSISISNAVGILQSAPPPTTTQTTMTVETTEETTTIMTTSEMPTNETETTAAPKEDNTLLIVGIVALIVLVLIVVAVLAWCLCCRNKDPEEDDDDEEEAEENNKSNPYALSQVAVLKG